MSYRLALQEALGKENVFSELHHHLCPEDQWVLEGRAAIVATGCLTDICVETAVRHAVSLDYLVTVASDCCASFTTEAHGQALVRMERAFGRVVDSSAIASHWR